jgi:hypothetical protein
MNDITFWRCMFSASDIAAIHRKGRSLSLKQNPLRFDKDHVSLELFVIGIINTYSPLAEITGAGEYLTSTRLLQIVNGNLKNVGAKPITERRLASVLSKLSDAGFLHYENFRWTFPQQVKDAWAEFWGD